MHRSLRGISSLRVVSLSTLCAISGAIAGCRTGSGIAGATTTATGPTAAPARLVLPAAFADSVHSERIASIATLHTIVNLRAPWRAWVLEVEPRPCFDVQAVKGAAIAPGRNTTSALLRTLPPSSRAIAAVNADFFLFAPPGVPTNLHIEQGHLIAGPGPNPVVWSDRDGRVHIDTLVARGRVTTTRGTMLLTAWNRPSARTAGIVDAAWGIPFDSTMRSARVYRLVPLASGGRASGARYLVRQVSVSDRGVGGQVVHGDTLLLHVPPTADTGVAPRDGDTATVQIGLALRSAGANATIDVRTLDVRNAVGGRPILLVDSMIVRDVDTEGNDGFRALNPRTAVGIDRSGRRLWLAVIDGRQQGRSMGMTLRQTAELLQAVGATKALNLDGGGSSAMVIRQYGNDTVNGIVKDTLRVVNRPSDAGGERPVANALAISATCAVR